MAFPFTPPHEHGGAPPDPLWWCWGLSQAEFWSYWVEGSAKHAGGCGMGATWTPLCSTALFAQTPNLVAQLAASHAHLGSPTVAVP